ncbi:hepatic lectin-like [Xiphophorus hellerii]|uniref:hepatic lectin-like n=1 Tax=Xiphophorus hellerii TaxID=8084 RepID=UPI0013B46E7C|nr:hepatic lectin-like [Xiphophorus hellerii]
MAEADVTYADVKFTRQRTKVEDPAADVVYSDIMMKRTKHPVCPKCAIDAQQAGQGIRSKVTTERMVLLVLISILVVTIIALAVKINSRPKMNTASSTPTCPPPPTWETFLKCKEEWEKHGGNCYYFNNRNSTWNESQHSCADLGSDLVKIDSREEQVFLEERVRNLMNDNQDRFWIGLTDSVEEGKWFWVDGSPLNESLSFWNQSQPDNRSPGRSAEAKAEDKVKVEAKAGADCVRMGKKGKHDDLKSWFDTSCNYPQKSICEKTAEQSSCVSEV